MVRSQRRLIFPLWVLQGGSTSPFTPLWVLARGLGSPEVTKWRRLQTKTPFIGSPSHLPLSLNLIALLGSRFGTSSKGHRGPKMQLKNPAPLLLFFLAKREWNKKKKWVRRDKICICFPRCNLWCVFHPVTLTGIKKRENWKRWGNNLCYSYTVDMRETTVLHG